ncbi:MAG TPA: hypothetical protein VGI65_06740 [Steroidobacteraceae bacterium]|jgi:hypothetical protein
MLTPESLWQLSGAVTGGLVGGLAGFAANLLRLQVERGIQRRNVAAALAAEMEALCDLVTEQYLKRLELTGDPSPHQELYPYQGFRGERDYMPVFRVLGQNLGVLRRPLPRELIFWYMTLTICLERARDLYDLAKSQASESAQYAFVMAQVQREEIQQLLNTAPVLMAKLERLAGR